MGYPEALRGPPSPGKSSPSPGLSSPQSRSGPSARYSRVHFATSPASVVPQMKDDGMAWLGRRPNAKNLKDSWDNVTPWAALGGGANQNIQHVEGS